MAVSVVANRIGRTFPAAGSRFSDQETFPAFPASLVLGYPKVSQASDEFPMRHGLCCFKKGFLEVDGVRKRDGCLLGVDRQRQPLVWTAGKKGAPHVHRGGTKQVLAVVVRQRVFNVGGDDVRHCLFGFFRGRGNFHKIKLETMGLIALIGLPE